MSLMRRLFSSAYRRARRAEGRGEYREAAALYAEAEAWDKLAHTYERLLPHALDTEERVTIQSNWAMVLADGLGDIPGALALYDQILEEAPEDKEAFQAMLALQKRAE